MGEKVREKKQENKEDWKMRRNKFFAKLIQGILTITLLPSAVLCSEQVLNLGNGTEPKDLDPQTVTGVPESNIVQSLFEGLVGKDPKTLFPVPGVAERWEISKDGRTYTFFLRKNAKWSNGDPVTAQDFIYSWKRLLDPKTASEYAFQGYYFKGGKDFHLGNKLGNTKEEKALGLKALDSWTLQVVLENPTPYFLSLLYHHSLYPVHQKTVEQHGMRWTRPGNLISNGPFQLESWKMNHMIVVRKSPHYWDRENVKLQKVKFYAIEKTETEEKMFLVKRLHATSSVPTEKISHWEKRSESPLQKHPYLGTYYYWINVKRKPLDEPKVRKALALAIDREKLIRYVVKGGQAPAQSFTPPGTGGFMPEPRLPKDLSRVEEAKKLLKEAGYPNGLKFPKVEILYNTSEGHKKIAEAISQMWSENLGIKTTLYNQEWKVFLDTQQTRNYSISRAGWIADYNDPFTFLDLLSTQNSGNRAGWSHPEYDELLEKSQKELNPKKRLEIFQRAESILLEELPVIPLYIYTRLYLLSPQVKGWYPNVEDIHPLKNVWIE